MEERSEISQAASKYADAHFTSNGDKWKAAWDGYFQGAYEGQSVMRETCARWLEAQKLTQCATAIRSLGRGQGATTADGGSPAPFVDTPLQAAMRQAFDSPTQTNLRWLVTIARSDLVMVIQAMLNLGETQERGVPVPPSVFDDWERVARAALKGPT